MYPEGKYPDVLRHEPMIACIKGMINFFNQSLSGRQIVRYTDHAAEFHASAVTYRFADQITSLARMIEPPGLSKNLLNLVRSGNAAIPAHIHLGVLSRAVRSPQIAMQIGEEVVGVLNGWRCKAPLLLISREAIILKNSLGMSRKGSQLFSSRSMGKEG